MSQPRKGKRGRKSPIMLRDAVSVDGGAFRAAKEIYGDAGQDV
ncbi:unnamed protein product [marine sediment metagenome]|uniref:Uncharacterized protein n=1 Tax=marine sediment metagenome TaxID=412755 RepID=X0WR94_9ZZZZ